jgi:MFS family permease
MDQADQSGGRHDPYAPLRLVDYRRFLIGGVLAEAGAEMQMVVVGWDLYERTRSAFALGFVGLAMVIPVFLFALPAGHAADRFSRKRILQGATALMALASVGLAALSAASGPIWAVYACLALTGTASAIGRPSRWAILRQLVPDDLVNSAVTWNSSGWQLASVGGPALGGLVVAATGGTMAAYLVDVLFSTTFLLLLIPIRPREVDRGPESLERGSLLAGLRFVLSSKLILATITLDLFAVLLGGAVALLPIFAHDILQVGPIGLGLLRAAPSIGAAAMALTLAHRPPLRNAGPALLWAVAGFGLATIGFGLSTSPILSFVLLAATGALDNISVVVRSTLIQVLTPEGMRGRVSAVNSIFIGSSNELGGFESGITAEWFGPVGSVVGGGLGTLAVVGLVRLIWPSVALLGSLSELGKAEEDPEGDCVASGALDDFAGSGGL